VACWGRERRLGRTACVRHLRYRARHPAGPATTRLTTAAWGLGALLCGAALVRAWRPERSTSDVVVTAGAPWLLAPSWLLLAGAVSAHRRSSLGHRCSLVAHRGPLAALAAVLATYHAACAWPRPNGPRNAARALGGPQLRVAFANVWCRNRSVEGVLCEVAAGDPDIIGLAEVTSEHMAAIDALLPLSAYPWRWARPDAPRRSSGMALLSRLPIDLARTWSSQGHPQLEATVRPDGARPFRLLVVHTWSPVGRRNLRRWKAQLAEIASRAQAATASGAGASGAGASGAGASGAGATLPSAGALPTVVIGDFNASRQHRSFERLLTPGWDDAGDLRFGGWRATWPTDRFWLPALFRLDHILAGPGISVLSGRPGRSRGSDHRPVSAVLRPAAPPAAG